MAENVVKNYQIQAIIGQSDQIVYYRVQNDTLEEFVMAEYFRTDICSRDDDGQVLVREDQLEKFKSELFDFVKTCGQLKELLTPALIHPVEAFYERGTAYVVWRPLYGRAFIGYVSGQNAPVPQATRLAMLRPLLSQLDIAAQRGIFFPSEAQNLVLVNDNEIVMDMLFDSRMNLQSAIQNAALMLYSVIGARANIALRYPARNELISDQLYALMADIMNAPAGTTLKYHSFMQLFNDIELAARNTTPTQQRAPQNAPQGQAVTNSGNVAGTAQQSYQGQGVPVPPQPVQTPAPNMGYQAPVPPPTASPKNNSGNSGKIAAVIIVVVLALVLLLGITAFIFAGRNIKSAIEESAVSDDYYGAASESDESSEMTEEETTTSPEDLYSYVTLPDDYDERINYSAAAITIEREGKPFVIHRFWKEGWHLAYENGIENEVTTIIASDIFPSFLASDGEYVYYSDSFAENKLFKVAIEEGAKPQELSDDMAAYISLGKDKLYYVNVSEDYALYEIGKDGSGKKSIRDEATFDLCVDPDSNALFFTDEEFVLYRMEPDTQHASPISDKEHYHTIVSGDKLFALQIGTDQMTELVAYTLDGNPAPLSQQVISTQYNVYGDYLYYVETESKAMKRLNLENGEHSVLFQDAESYWLTAGEENAVYYFSKEYNGQFCRWTPENDDVGIDFGVGKYDYEPMSEELLNSMDEDWALGTTISNIVNGSFVVQDADGNLYFQDHYKSQSSDGFIFNIWDAVYKRTPEGKVSRISESLGSKTILYKDRLYFAGYGEDGIVSIALDGSDKKTMQKGFKASRLFAHDNKIYALHNSENKLYSMNLDGGDRKLVVGDEMDNFFIYNDRIYFISRSDSGYLYSCDFDGLNKDRLVELDEVESCVPSNGMLYLASDDSSNGGIYSCNPDGSNLKQILNIRTEDIHVYREWIYYSTTFDGMKMARIDGEVVMGSILPQPESWMTSYKLNILGDMVYLDIGESGEKSVYGCDLDGSNSFLLGK